MADPSKTEATNSRRVKINALNSDLEHTHLIHGRTRTHYADWAGHLSLKTFTNGTAFYNAGAGFYRVGDQQYLLLNEMQRYQITIDSATHVESFCIFFESGFAEEVNRSYQAETAKLLDDPHKPPTERINFVQKLYTDTRLDQTLNELKYAVLNKTADDIWIKENLHGVMNLLLDQRTQTFREIDRLSAIRAATREEIYRRIYRARDFMASSYEQPLKLEEIAQTACLSTNHFLRTFKQIFRQTPYQYLTALRLEQAKHLLEKTDLSIINVCQMIGFESHSSFTLLFKRHFGIAPEKYRARQKR